MRRKTRNFLLGKVPVGSDFPVTVQSMCSTRTSDAEATLKQIVSLHRLGCEIIRVSVDTPGDAAALRRITAESPMPVVADIQFSAEMALAAMEAGAAAVRINPGIVRNADALRAIARMALQKDLPIRVGANAGSLPRHEITDRIARGMERDSAIAEALCDAAQAQCEALESAGVRKIKVALKSSSVPVTLLACRTFARRNDYPLHLGLTEAGIPARGVIKSAAAIGALLMEGIGDTIRVSLTAPPEEEVTAALRILESCEIRPAMPEVVSCPTCGRTEIDLIGLAEEVEKMVRQFRAAGGVSPLRKIAVMGCPVNGPGEAREADFGIAGTRNGQLVLFRRGQILCTAGKEEALAMVQRALKGENEK